MSRAVVREYLNRVDDLAKEVEQHVPADRPEMTDFRSDVAGLLTVLTCATYETCVKQVIYAYAGRNSPMFGIYAEKRYDRINSKIEVSDLKNYASTFHPDLGNIFKENLERFRSNFIGKTSYDIVTKYNQLLKWRHSFAHSGARVTTVEEVLKHHSAAKRVLFIFSDSFEKFGT